MSILLMLSAHSVPAQGQPATGGQYFVEILENSDAVKCGRLDVQDSTRLVKVYYENDTGLVWPREHAVALINQQAGSRPLFFIHGFMAAILPILQRTTLGFNYLFFRDPGVRTKAVIHIIWPSNRLSYRRSKRIIRTHHAKLARILRDFIRQQPDRQIDLLCHSMGNRLFLETIRRNPFDAHSFRKIILAAPDVGISEFEVSIPYLQQLADSVLVLTHRKDRILLASQWRNHSPRLGRTPPPDLPSFIQVLDCTDAPIDHTRLARLNRHTYFLASDRARHLMEAFLYNDDLQAPSDHTCGTLSGR